jgi:hypothetical protein
MRLDSLIVPSDMTGLTTPIEVKFSDGRIVSGSGFFYVEYAPEEPAVQGRHWRAVTHVYVVTAKHVIQPKRLKDMVNLTYAMRTQNGNHVDWHRFELSSSDLGKRLHLCQKAEVDVAVVDVTDDLNAEMTQPLEQQAGWSLSTAPVQTTSQTAHRLRSSRAMM